MFDLPSSLIDMDVARDRGRPPKSEKALLILKEYDPTIFKDRFGEFAIRLAYDDHYRTYMLPSEAFENWLVAVYAQRTGEVIGDSARKTVLDTLQGLGELNAIRSDFHTRVGRHDDKIYIDVCDDSWQAIEIDQEGWRVIRKTPVIFRRSKGMKPLPIPQSTDRTVKDIVSPLINVEEDGHLCLILTWLLFALDGRGPYPILLLKGEQGSGKSKLAEVLRSLIDPHQVPHVSPPENQEALDVATRHNWMIALDNVSWMPNWLSDGLCRIATGAGSAYRKLYTDEAIRYFKARRPIVMNSID
ncbi:MAG: hypothetical protein KKD01_19590, partial [Proteobacteria bacterium]|nr:hypothetical protein [Pseudomonadota bacterium]